MGLKINTLGSVDAPQNADSVAPLGDSFVTPDFSTVTQAAIIGTYTLQHAQNRKRTGSALVVHASRQQTPSGPTFHLDKQTDTPLPGVLDVCANDSVLYAACAEDSVARLTATPPYTQISADLIIPPDQSDLLTLSLDVTPGTETFIATSHSSGDISLYSSTPTATRLLDRRKTHDLEAWTVCRRDNVLYSGGDDGALVAWTPNSPQNVFRTRTAHNGVGITALAVEPGEEYEIWSGGYDDTLRVWDVRFMRNCLAESPVGGGVWRVKFHPRGFILVATMYDGFKIVRRQEEFIDVVARYDDHKSIAYGAAWLPALDYGSTIVALTASFYDCSVRLWCVDMREEARQSSS